MQMNVATVALIGRSPTWQGTGLWTFHLFFTHTVSIFIQAFSPHNTSAELKFSVHVSQGTLLAYPDLIMNSSSLHS